MFNIGKVNRNTVNNGHPFTIELKDGLHDLHQYFIASNDIHFHVSEGDYILAEYDEEDQFALYSADSIQ